VQLVFIKLLQAGFADVIGAPVVCRHIVIFQLIDKDNPGGTLRVSYRGAVPDAFKAGAEVIVEGGLDSVGKTFTATTLITKCPSKYQKQNRG